MAAGNPFAHTLSSIQVDANEYKFYDLNKLNDERLARLPYSIRILLESAVRNCDNFEVKPADVETILDWVNTSNRDQEIPFKAARVILQDFTGVPAVVDLAAMRDAVSRLGGDPSIINPAVPVDLVVDHSVQVDYHGTPDSVAKNQEKEMERNAERFTFLKWGSKAFQNFKIVPPGSGIVHQVNLEYLARVVFNKDGILYPDSLVGTDSHTTMINGLGVLGWGVGGIEAEAVMLNQPVSMVLPQVVGYKLTGRLRSVVTSTDLVLTITEALRKLGVVGKFVEFYGDGVQELSLADRATLANMAPEYGATMGYFPIDRRSIEFLHQTGRDAHQIKYIEAYLRASSLFVDYEQKQETPVYSQTLELDLSTVNPSLAGPKRPHDRIPLDEMKSLWNSGLTAKVGFKSYGLAEEAVNNSANFSFQGKDYTLNHGSVVIAAITSCTNTSNPAVMLGAGLLARNAVRAGLSVKPYIKTSLAPGSGVVTRYLEAAGLQPFLDQLGFYTVGYGCTTCIGNSGDIAPEVSQAIEASDLVVAAVLSGNRNFEGRVHPLTRANYLASPLLVVAYALTGTVNIDFEHEPVGHGPNGPVFLPDIWPTNQEIQEVINQSVLPHMFSEVYSQITNGTEQWRALVAPEAQQFPWAESTYIHQPPYFTRLEMKTDPIQDIKEAYCLLNLGDSITTDHISPAGNIARNSPAGRYLIAKGVDPKDFNSYGARRGHDEVMARGTFANTRLVNKMVDKTGPNTVHIPSGQTMAIWDAAEQYMQQGLSTIILGGAMYGSGSSRDWAAKGPMLQGVKAVIAVSFERIHRSNLVGMGIVPLQFKDGENADTLGLTGRETFSIDLTSAPLRVGQDVVVRVSTGAEFTCKLRLDTEVELKYYENGGVLNYVLRNLINKHINH
eukprot:TRINITY_DN1839_c0_g2_i1.p1 TRINITY_DN1839_c0_g2~~TRINITY_DN1839_c0_g2_i1.p1  ORF type:complete len:919 (+),score=421.23 TRINITY_DN1839_c0_g2_i1:72-2759(+)